MKTVTVGVSSIRDVQLRTAAAFRGQRQGAYISFASEEILWKTITPKRRSILKVDGRTGSDGDSGDRTAC